MTPPLQPAFTDTHGRHKVAEALAKLQAGIKGYWVEVPLDWGRNESTTLKPLEGSPKIIASIDKKSTSKETVYA
jgi:phospholipase D1/2